MAVLALPLILALLPSASWAARVSGHDLALERQGPPAHLDRLAARGSDLQAFHAAVEANEERASVLLDASRSAARPDWPDVLKSELGDASKVGSGSYGEVYVAPLKCSPGFKVAVKVMKERQSLTAENVDNEVNLMRAAFGHPNVVQYFGHAESSKCHFIMMEAAGGGDMGDYMQSDHSLALILGMLRGVKGLHDLGLVHRDIKPENVLVSSRCGDGATCAAKVADLGFACSLLESKAGAPRCPEGDDLSGTPLYMSPEAWDGKHSVKNDVWAMGLVLYKMKFGHLPSTIEAEKRKLSKVEGAIKNFDILADEDYKSLLESESDWKELLAGMLAKEFDARWDSTTALARAEAWGKGSFADRASGQVPKLPECFGKAAA